MISAIAGIAGGIGGAFRIAGGATLGGAAVWAWMSLVAVPAAVRAAEDALRLEAAEAAIEAVQEAREIERGILNATDEELRRILGGDPNP
ncbi:MAG: hypothetical protein AAGC81_02465 [Pseudomonadota bacterium]